MRGGADNAGWLRSRMHPHGFLAERLLRERRVIVIPGEAFGPGGAGFLRVSYAAHDDDIRKGIRALGEELALTQKF